MGKVAYSDEKALWHASDIGALRAKALTVPRHIQLILSDLCNQDCHFCSYRMDGGFSTEQFGELHDGLLVKNPSRFIPAEKAREILEDAAEVGVLAVQFTGGGEPTVHPQHMEIFAHALDLGLECALVTNGVLLRPGWELVLPRFEWLRVSLDAGTAETYARIRRSKPEVFSRVLGNIKVLSECSKFLGVGYVVTPENYMEIVQGCRAAEEAGAAYIRLSAAFSRDYDAPYRPIYQTIKRQIEIARAEFGPDFVVDLFGDRISDLRQHAPDYDFCGYQFFNMYIGGDQKVYRCCTTSYTKHGEVADLKGGRLRDWILSDDRAKSYFDFDARSCEVCQFNKKNKAIGRMLGDPPLHVNFV